MPAQHVMFTDPPASPDHEVETDLPAASENGGGEDSQPFGSFHGGEMGAMVGAGNNDAEITEEEDSVDESSSPACEPSDLKEISMANNRRKSSVPRKITNRYFDSDEEDEFSIPSSPDEMKLGQAPKETNGSNRRQKTIDEMIASTLSEKTKKKKKVKRPASPPLSPSLISAPPTVSAATQPLGDKKKAVKKKQTKRRRLTQQEKLIEREEDMFRHFVEYAKAANPKFKGPWFTLSINPSLQNGK